MRTIEQIKNLLNSIDFKSIDQWVAAFLEVFEIPNITIGKISDSIKWQKSASLYRRALFIKFDEQEQVTELISKFKDSYPVIFCLGAENLSIYTKENSVLGLSYSDVSEYIELFEGIRNRGKIEKDIYTTLEFAPIVGELYSQLSLNDNSKNDAFNYILNLITVVFVDQITSKNVFARYSGWLKSSTLDTINSFVNDLISQNYYSAYLTKIPTTILHNARTRELTVKLLLTDISELDSEVFGSLVYRIFSNSDEVSLYGNQMAKSNVDKILNPLFVEPILELAKSSSTDALNKLLTAIFFDPTNSPGCFLTEALTKVIETSVKLSEIYEIQHLPIINFQNFIALVDNDIAFRLTKINIFIVYLQYIKSLDLLSTVDTIRTFNNIKVFKDNQLSSDWNYYCPNTGNVYVIGSPKFQGNRKLSQTVKELMQPIFGHHAKLADTDLCAAWLVKGARYISGSNSEVAFVLTNSICQGSQVSTIWPIIFDLNCHISFAYTPFKWSNSESRNIAVTVIAISLRFGYWDTPKLLFDGSTCYRCDSISPYLLQNSELIVYSRSQPISDLPVMRKGNMEYASGALIIEADEYKSFISADPRTVRFIRKLKGSEEFINGGQRFCLWIKDSELAEANSITVIRERIIRAKENRANSTATQKSKANPHKFRETFDTPPTSQTLIVPSVSSENREYIPMGFVYNDTIISNLAFAVYNCEPWLLSLLESKMHHVWIKLVCGQLESRFRYSNVLCYNTFPVPVLSHNQKQCLSELSLELIRIREEFCEYTIGDLYNHLPPKLKNIHKRINEYVDGLYSNIAFSSDYQRLSVLMDLYKHLTESHI